MKISLFTFSAVWAITFPLAVPLAAGEANSAGQADPTPSGPPDNVPLIQAPQAGGLWTSEGVGHGFRPHLQEFDVALGAGVSTDDLGGKQTHDLLLTRIDYGWMLGETAGRDQWYGGNWEFLQEGFGGWQGHPADRYLIGTTSLLRYNVATGTRWVPFLDGGIGFSATDIGHPDLGSTGEFNGQIGPGVSYFWGEHTALTLQYRYMHTSSGGLSSPNQGVNENICYFGVSWFF